MEKITPSQVASWYHSQILRIPHGNQNPTKRYMDDEQLLMLFDGYVVIQEKVDGKMSFAVDKGGSGRIIRIYEDMTGKHTVHDHIMKYKRLPANKRIELESIYVSNSDNSVYIAGHKSVVEYATIKLVDPTVEVIHGVLELFAAMPSHFGNPLIEGIVIKNYSDGKNVLFGKWINDEFEDLL